MSNITDKINAAKAQVAKEQFAEKARKAANAEIVQKSEAQPVKPDNAPAKPATSKPADKD